MDESWRTPIGMSAAIFRRKSTENTSRRSFHRESKPLDPEDFDDVFGGPPRTVFSGKFSGGDFDRSDYFYENIFRVPVKLAADKGGRNLPEFRIPAAARRSEEFCVDYLKMDYDEERRSRSRSKSNSSSAEEFSPFRPPISDDDVYSPIYVSTLRPIKVQSEQNKSTMMYKVQQRHEEKPHVTHTSPSFTGKQFSSYEHTENFKSTHFSFSRRGSSPESMSRGAYSYSSVKVSALEEDDSTSKFQYEVSEEEEDDIDSSYVIEINTNNKGGTDEGLGVDEAIAWAKESFLSHSSPEESSTDTTERPVLFPFSNGSVNGCELLHLQEDSPNILITEEEEQREMDVSREMELLEEDIKLWSSGKERNIESLLSTLQNILWPNSGWYPIPPTNLYESSLVKKAYQKARLCLHPDKLQQRGATVLQKYVAARIFPILQEAWAAYISQDIIISAHR